MADNDLDEHNEQIDLDGDNEIEELMDEVEYNADEEDDDKILADDYADERHENHDYEGVEEEQANANAYASEGLMDDSCPVKLEENLDEEKNDDEIQKHAELLSLPPHGSEVFIGGIPKDVTEVDLKELCEPFGELYQVKLVKDKDKKESKGYAFLTFTKSNAAQLAIEELHDKEYKGRTLRCSLSQSKHRLFIGNIPKNLTDEDMKKILEENGPGVENIELLKDVQNNTRNRGFVFVEYYNHSCADYARQKMSTSDFKIDGSSPTVTWADPKNTDSSSSTQVKAVYVRNLPENTNSERLKELFVRHGEITKVVLPGAKAGNKREFGFIHFAERSSALKAVKSTEKYELDGQVIEAVLAKPQADKRPSSYGLSSYRPGLMPSQPSYPAYGVSGGDPYGSYVGGYGGGSGYEQPVIYGRGPMPAGMRMVPMVLPDGRLGYVLQQPGSLAPPPPPHRRHERSGDGGSRGNDRNQGRRYHPY